MICFHCLLSFRRGRGEREGAVGSGDYSEKSGLRCVFGVCGGGRACILQRERCKAWGGVRFGKSKGKDDIVDVNGGCSCHLQMQRRN